MFVNDASANDESITHMLELNFINWPSMRIPDMLPHDVNSACANKLFMHRAENNKTIKQLIEKNFIL